MKETTVSVNYKLIAVDVGEALKNTSTLAEISRVAQAIFSVEHREQPNPGITSSRAMLVYEWIMSVQQSKLSEEQKRQEVGEFASTLLPEDSPALHRTLHRLREGPATPPPSDLWECLHPRVVELVRKKFGDGHFADAAETALKDVNSRVKRMVRQATGEERDGADLMNFAFSPKKPVIVLGDLSTESGRNLQLGYMQVFAGTMTGIRNPAAHENVELTENEATHILHLASLLMLKLDGATVERRRQGASE
jgi:uncharacterized protein (TIGR02391 family)